MFPWQTITVEVPVERVVEHEILKPVPVPAATWETVSYPDVVQMSQRTGKYTYAGQSLLTTYATPQTVQTDLTSPRRSERRYSSGR